MTGVQTCALPISAEKLNAFKGKVKALKNRTMQAVGIKADEGAMAKIKALFSNRMDDDLDVKGAFDALDDFLLILNTKEITPSVASGYLKGFKDIDQVLQILSPAS